MVEVLLHLTKKSSQSTQVSGVTPCPPGEKGEMQVVPVLLHLVTSISAIRLYLPQDLRPLDNRMSVLKSMQVKTSWHIQTNFLVFLDKTKVRSKKTKSKSVYKDYNYCVLSSSSRECSFAGVIFQEVHKRFQDGIPLLDPIDDLGIREKGLKEVVKVRNILTTGKHYLLSGGKQNAQPGQKLSVLSFHLKVKPRSQMILHVPIIPLISRCLQKIEAFEHRMYSHPMQKDSKLEDLYNIYERKMKVGLPL